MLDRQLTLTLFSAPSCPQCHRVRIALAEKELDYKTVFVHAGQKLEDLAELNPYNSVPTLVDRDIVLYDTNVILEYLDERFPHPPLMPMDPITRARFRLAMHHIEVDWYGQLKKLSSSSSRIVEGARRVLRETLITHANMFRDHQYFMNENFSILDCSLAPVLWRLPSLKVEMPKKKSHPVCQYAKRIFMRPSFRKSLTEIEAELEETH